MAGAVDRLTLGREALTAEILRQTAARGPEKSICPSEVARALAPEDWRRHMHAVRAAAAALAAAGQLEILRKGKPIAPEAMHGVIRLRQPGSGET